MYPQCVVDAALKYRVEHAPEYDAIRLSAESIERIARRMMTNQSRDLFHLYREVSGMPLGGTYLEIGSALGGSILCAYEASKIFDRQICIRAISTFGDPVGRSECMSVAADCNATVIEMRSDEAHVLIEDGSVDLLLIDGRHVYESVLSDLKNYCPKVRVGGVILCHDFDIVIHPDVVRAVMEHFRECKIVKLRGSCFCKIVKGGQP